ncbi:hypothetical protein FEM48_Zijuj01G0156700 [Ziziphus jujuba var. spinosa]|uniref:Uncharacterized protein n=1 Tax=Ziziphus jujuba var. spinosa TaxID=714518 RepID=A0A978W238_ZIZJJ|nr:hypothetical protein FEM48_Zijuj01G0156700 [Ziziphus jujuba var. spinosa]
MATTPSTREEISSAQAVLLGALAPGVNGPTWNTLKTAFLMLGFCLAVMLGLAFSSSDSYVVADLLYVSLIATYSSFSDDLYCLSIQEYICNEKQPYRRPNYWNLYRSDALSSMYEQKIKHREKLFRPDGFQDLKWLQALDFMIRVMHYIVPDDLFLAQTGLVSVEHQLREMDLALNDGSEMIRKEK